MTRREREEAALERLAHPPTYETDHTYEQDVHTIREGLHLAHGREDFLRKQLDEFPGGPGPSDFVEGWFKGLSRAKEIVVRVLDSAP